MEALSSLAGAFGVLGITWTLLLATVSVLISYWYLTIPKGLPPGPLGLPVLGYLPFLGKRPHVTFMKLGRKYGPVFRFYLGNRLVLILNNFAAYKEAYVNQAETFAGRPPIIMSMASGNKYSVMGADGDMFKDQHRFILKMLRDLGVGKTSIEPQIMDEIQHFLAKVESFQGKATNFSSLVCRSVLNNVGILVLGHRFDYEDHWFVETASLITDMMTKAKSVSIFVLFPWLRWIPGVPWMLNQDDLLPRRHASLAVIKKMLQERKQIPVEDLKRDCIMNAFILEQRARQISRKGYPFVDEALEENTFTMMVGGMDTTAGYLQWLIMFMAKYPEVQAKVQKEIDEVIGSDRTPCYNDRLLTPYTEATILEIQRSHTLGTCGLPHRCMEDTELYGYKIPKDTIVISNNWSVNNDEELWDDVHAFRPERFLVPNGTKDLKEYIIPFSMGKRECIGKSLAKMELYLYFTAILQKFNILSEDGSPPNMEGEHGFIIKPKRFMPRLVLRNQK